MSISQSITYIFYTFYTPHSGPHMSPCQPAALPASCPVGLSTDSYEEHVCSSWIWKDLSPVRNSRPSIIENKHAAEISQQKNCLVLLTKLFVTQVVSVYITMSMHTSLSQHFLVVKTQPTITVMIFSYMYIIIPIFPYHVRVQFTWHCNLCDKDSC